MYVVAFIVGAIMGFLLLFVMMLIAYPVTGKMEIDDSHPDKNYYRFVWSVDPNELANKAVLKRLGYSFMFIKIVKRNDLESINSHESQSI